MIRTLTLVAALLVAVPAFAQDHDRWGDDEWSDRGRDDGRPRDWDDEDDGSSQRSSFDGAPSWDDFRRDRELSWAGEWIDTPEYGVVWRPTHVDSGWRPYAYGRWQWTNAGWSWESDEPFGWAVYHYGRWALVGGSRWVWLPGRVWAPAWVSWRYGDGFVGWCPLGPRRVVYERPQQWVFVETRFIFEPVRHHAVPIPYAQRYFAHAQPVPRGPHAGPPRLVIERAVGRPMRAAPVVAPRAFAPRQVDPRPVTRPYAAVRPAVAPSAPTARPHENRGAPPRNSPHEEHVQEPARERDGDHRGPHVRQ